MSQITSEFGIYAPQYADLDELLGTQQLWQRDNQLKELYNRFGTDAVDALCRRRPDLDLSDVARVLAARTPTTHQP